MKNPSIIHQLQSVLPEGSVPWVVAALRQDTLIWASLHNPDFMQRLLASGAHKPEAWSPAALALQAMDVPISPSSLSSEIQYPLNASLRRKAARTYEGLSDPQDPASLESASPLYPGIGGLVRAGLLAIALRERRRLIGSWDGLIHEFRLASDSTDTQQLTIPLPPSLWKTPLACLYSMVPDPFELIRSLIPEDATGDHIALALHAMLSTPLPLEELSSWLYTLLMTLPIAHQGSMLRQIYAHRPTLATELARKLLTEEPAREDETTRNSDGASFRSSTDYLSQLSRLISRSETYQLAEESSEALPYLTTAWDVVHNLEAELAAQMAVIRSQNGDIDGSTYSWIQAIEMAPNNPLYRANLAQVLIDSGKVAEARNWLPDENSILSGRESHPVFLLAIARLAFQTGQIEFARQTASTLLASLESDNGYLFRQLQTDSCPNPITDNLRFPEQLARLLLELGLPTESSRAAQLGLSSQPCHPDLLVILGHALAAAGKADEAAKTLQLAIAIQPNRLDFRTQYSDYLETAGEWEMALPERLNIVEQFRSNANATLPPEAMPTKISTGVALRALANCALNAGKPELSLQASQEALSLNGDDGNAHVLVGKALAQLGDITTAQDHFVRATDLIPHLADPWLALAKIEKDTGQAEKALETLRVAAQALPTSPSIYLALGEAYLEDWQGRGHPALTQALTAFQRASGFAPEDTQISLRLGQTLFQLGHQEEARQVLEHAYQLANYHYDLAYTYAQILLAIHQPRAAVEPLGFVFNQALESDIADPEPYLTYARTLMEVREKPEDALRATQRVLELAPKHPEALGLRAEAMAAMGDLPSAMNAFQLALETDLVDDRTWNSRLALGLGKVALAMAQPDIAIAALQEASLANPQDFLILRTLAEGYQSAGLLEEALKTARTAIRVATDDIDTLTWFADHAMEWNEQPAQMTSSGDQVSKLSSGVKSQLYIEAVNALTRAIQLAPQNADLYVRLGKVQLLANDPQAALITFHLVISSETATSDDLYQTARYLLDVGDAQNAVACLERAMHYCPGDSLDLNIQQNDKTAIAYTLIEAYHQAGNLQAALSALDQAIDFCPDDISLYRLKSDLLMETGRSLEALDCLEKTIVRFPEEANALDLHYQAALILRSNGDLPAALAHCERILAISDPLSPNPHNLAAKVLAAELARALLLPDRPRAFLGAPPNLSFGAQSEFLAYLDKMGESTCNHHFSYFCLRAELALERKKEEEAAESLLTATNLASLAAFRENTSEHSFMYNQLPLVVIQSRLLAIQSRLNSLRSNHTEAVRTLQEAMQTIDQNIEDRGIPRRPEVGKELPEGEAPTPGAPNRLNGTPHLQSLAEAAISIGQWDTALYLLKLAQEFTAREPMANLSQARTLVLRAEAQRLYQQLDVQNHCPGPVALTKHTRKAFEQAIDVAQQQISLWLTSKNPDDQSGSQQQGTRKSLVNDPQASIQAQSEIARWRARGHVVFQPGPQSTQALSATLALMQPSPDDVVAQIAALDLTSEYESGDEFETAYSITQEERLDISSAASLATRAALAFPYHPRVLTQLALLLSKDKDHLKDALQAAIRAANIVNNSYPDVSENPRSDGTPQNADQDKVTHDNLEPIALTNYMLARIAQSADELITAQPAIQKAVNYWPDEPRWQSKAAEIFADCGDVVSSIPHLEEATRLEPNFAPHYLALGQAYQVTAQGDVEKLEAAIQVLEKACDLSANNPQNWLALARAYFEANNLEPAATSAERAISLAPDEVQPLIVRAEIALQAGDPNEAHEQLLAALHLQEISQNPAARKPAEDPILILLLARSLDALDRHDEALSILDMALPQASDPLPLLLERIQLLQRSQGLEFAMVTLQEIINEYPDEPTVLSLFAKYLAESGQVETAIRTAQRALQVSTPSDEVHDQHSLLGESQQAQLHLLLGRLLRNTGQLDQAVYHLNEAIRQSPNSLEAYLELGHTYENRREYDTALKIYNQAIKVAPKDPRPYYQAGLALKENKDYHSAETMLRRAATFAPNDRGFTGNWLQSLL